MQLTLVQKILFFGAAAGMLGYAIFLAMDDFKNASTTAKTQISAPAETAAPQK